MYTFHLFMFFLFLTGEYGLLDSETIKIARDNHNKYTKAEDLPIGSTKT